MGAKRKWWFGIVDLLSFSREVKVLTSLILDRLFFVFHVGWCNAHLGHVMKNIPFGGDSWLVRKYTPYGCPVPLHLHHQNTIVLLHVNPNHTSYVLQGIMRLYGLCIWVWNI